MYRGTANYNSVDLTDEEFSLSKIYASLIHVHTKESCI